MKWLKSISLSLFTVLFAAFSVFSIPSMSFAAKTTYKIEINKKTNKLYLYKNDKVYKSYPVATGRTETLTPEGVFKIGPKVKYPQWYNSKKKEVVPGWKKDYPKGKQDNPLGPRWMGLIVNGDKGNTYGIHGTNDESSIGNKASSGCIRMHVKDVIELFDKINVPTGTPVWIHSGTSNEKWMNGDSVKDVKADKGRVKITDRINIRQAPSTVSKIIGKANAGWQYNITGATKDWYQIKFDGNKTGYISKEYAQKIDKKETPAPNPKPDPKPTPEPKPDIPVVTVPEKPDKDDSKVDPKKPNSATVNVNFETSFTKYGSLKIEASLQSKQAEGTWKVWLDGKVIATEKGKSPNFSYVHKNPEFQKEDVNIEVTFDGIADKKQVTGNKKLKLIKTVADLHIKPSFKDNKLHIEASLKEHEKALGVWTVKLGKTQKMYLKSGKQLKAVFDTVTFNKESFPASVTFVGISKGKLVTAKYSKDLKIKIPGQETETESNNNNDTTDEKQSDGKEENPPTTPTTDDTTDKKETDDTTDETSTDTNSTNTEPTDTGEDQEKITTQNTDTQQQEPTSAPTDEQQQDTDTEQQTFNEVPQNESVQQQVGGKLPKTSTSYPLTIVLGFVLLLAGVALHKMRRAS